MPRPLPPPALQALLPSAFDAGQLWAFCIHNPEFGQTSEYLALADAGAEGLAALQDAFPATGRDNELVMAFALSDLQRLQNALACDLEGAGVLDAQALGVARAWPRWIGRPVASFFVWAMASGAPVSVWVRARSRAEAILAVARVYPEAQVLSVAALDDLGQQLDRLRQIVEKQDFGALFCDLRQAAPRPASAAQIGGYRMAEDGDYASPEEAMATHQEMFLMDLADEGHLEGQGA